MDQVKLTANCVGARFVQLEAFPEADLLPVGPGGVAGAGAHAQAVGAAGAVAGAWESLAISGEKINEKIYWLTPLIPCSPAGFS